MAHALALRRRPPCNKTNNRICNLLCYHLCGFLFCTPSNFSNQYHGLCFFVFLKQSQDIHKIGPYNGVTPDSKTGGLSYASLSQLPDGFVVRLSQFAPKSAYFWACITGR